MTKPPLKGEVSREIYVKIVNIILNRVTEGFSRKVKYTMFLPYNTKLTPVSRHLRKEMTPQEKHLWYDFLRNYPVKFYRQRVIKNFIVDFYCSQAKLVIELDGSQHYTEQGIAHDNERTIIFESLGLRVVRFSNVDIDKNFNIVCHMIHKAVQG